MKSFLVIGLGRFGTSLAIELCAQGHEVLAVDIQSERVQAVADQVTHCVVGDARPEKTNPIYLAHEKVILILVVERATGLIVDADTNMVCELTRRFLRSVFVGHSLVDDLEEIRNSLLDNYLGDSKRVLYAAARSARMKFLDSTSQARE